VTKLSFEDPYELVKDLRSSAHLWFRPLFRPPPPRSLNGRARLRASAFPPRRSLDGGGGGGRRLAASQWATLGRVLHGEESTWRRGAGRRRGVSGCVEDHAELRQCIRPAASLLDRYFWHLSADGSASELLR
jgi:hypothetical protein